MLETLNSNVRLPASSKLQVMIPTPLIALSLGATGSTMPGLGLAVATVLRIIILVQDIKDNDAGFIDLANDACDLVYILVAECQRITNNGRNIPDHIQLYFQTLSGNLLLIENFTKKKLKQNFLRKMISRTKVLAEIARYREVLRQSLDVYGLPQANVSIQEYLLKLMDQIQEQQVEVEAETQRRVEEDRHANLEERASQTPIHGQEEDRIAEDTILAQPSEFLEVEQEHEDRKCAREMARLKKPQVEKLGRTQEENARLKSERNVFMQRASPSPYPQSNLSPTSGPTSPMSPSMYGPNPYSSHLLPLPQPSSSQPQGGILLQNVSGVNISINSFPPPPPPIIHNAISGNISSVSISNVSNVNAKPRRKCQA